MSLGTEVSLYDSKAGLSPHLAEIAFSGFTCQKGVCNLFHNAGSTSAEEVKADHS